MRNFKLKQLVWLTVPLAVAGNAGAADKVCQVTSGLGFSSGHTGAAITGNWAAVNFSADGSGGTGQLYECNDASPTATLSCATIDVVLTHDGSPHKNYWVTSDVVPGWGWTTPKATKAVPSPAPAIGGSHGVIARFSVDDDSDLLMAKLVDMSGLLGYNNLCGQIWNTLGATGGNPVCVQSSDCQVFAAGDMCTGGFCVNPPPPPPPVVIVPPPVVDAGVADTAPPPPPGLTCIGNNVHIESAAHTTAFGPGSVLSWSWSLSGGQACITVTETGSPGPSTGGGCAPCTLNPSAAPFTNECQIIWTDNNGWSWNVWYYQQMTNLCTIASDTVTDVSFGSCLSTYTGPTLGIGTSFSSQTNYTAPGGGWDLTCTGNARD
jgi:hypothetical protein